MNVEKRDEIFAILCSLSDGQFDPAAKRRLASMIGRDHEDIRDELLALIDDCLYYDWTGGFEIKAMHLIWTRIGGSTSELQSRKTFLDMIA